MQTWWPDELDYAGAEHLDAAFVAGYDAKAQFDPTPDIAALVELGLGAESRVLDLGAGTGTFSAAVAPLVMSVIAVDPSPVMADATRRRLADDELDNVEVVEAGFLGYVHRGAAPDVVYSRNVLHQLPDFWKAVALHRIRELMSPSSVLYLRDLVYDFEPAEAPVALDSWMAGAGDDSARGYTGDDLAAHVREEFSTFSWLLEPILEHSGFDIVSRAHTRRTYATYVCTPRDL